MRKSGSSRRRLAFESHEGGVPYIDRSFAQRVIGLSGHASREWEVRADMQDEPRVKLGEARMEAAANMSATLSVKNGHTGRTVACTTEYGLIRKWASLSREEIPQDPLADELRAAIANAQCVQGEELVCYRGRSLERGSRPSIEQLGPPPEGKPCLENRHNRENESVLYLCSCEAAIPREVTTESGNELYCLVYRLPLQDLRVADFTELGLAPFVNGVLEIAESFNVEGRGPATYSFSQFIAQLVAEAFDGMMVPGVRGDPSFRYSNIVVFRPHPQWREWVDQQPTVVRTSVSAAGEETQ